MTTAYILLGSNIGNRLQHLEDAGSLLSDRFAAVLPASGGSIKKPVVIMRQSHVYETAAWGKIEQADYLNQAVQISTSLSPSALLAFTSAIESSLGRVRKKIWEPRIIDIDILFYGQEIVHAEKLTIPHPHLQQRRFVLVPLAEIAPNYVHPVLKRRIRDLLATCPDPLRVEQYTCS